MNTRIQTYSITSLVLLVLVTASGTGCIKEYSYEKRLKQDSTIIDEPVPSTGTRFPFCPSCIGRDTVLLSKWSFKTDSTLLCGEITNAVLSPDRTAFTFFGPSACSQDTGLIMTVYLNGVKLDADKSNISTERAIFEYYHRGYPDILLSRPLPGFTLTINRYIHQTGIASGSFSGNAATANGDFVHIKEGKFEIRFQ